MTRPAVAPGRENAHVRPLHEAEKDARDRLIDAARTDVVLLAEHQTRLGEVLDRLDRQAYGDADRLRGAADQLRRRFAGADAIPLLEAAADHAHPRQSRSGTTGPGIRSRDRHARRSFLQESRRRCGAGRIGRLLTSCRLGSRVPEPRGPPRLPDAPGRAFSRRTDGGHHQVTPSRVT